MVTKANVVAYGTVFKVASVLVALGGISALFVQDIKATNAHQGQAIEV